MAKYNISEIMKRAWEVRRRRNGGLSFGECLSRAWAEAKMKIANAKEIEEKKEFVDGMEITIDGYTRTLKRWTKGKFDRVYINGGSRKGDGFVDITNKTSYAGKATYAIKMAEVILSMKFSQASEL